VKGFGGLAPPTALSGNSGFIVVRSALPPDQMEDTMRSVVRELDPQMPQPEAHRSMTDAEGDGLPM
jgi:hypothetical protein